MEGTITNDTTVTMAAVIRANDRMHEFDLSSVRQCGERIGDGVPSKLV